MTSLAKHSYRDGDVELTGWLASPQGQPRGRVVVYPTIMNINPRVAEKSLALAEAGYAVLVADYYGLEIASPAEAQPHAKALLSNSAAYRQRLMAALQALSAIDGPAGAMAAIGFCMGGQAALEMARAGAKLSAVVSFHGLLGTARRAGPGDTIHPRILVCHGDKDPMVPRQQVTAFMEEMDRAGADWHLHVYSNARHGFTDPANDERPVDAVAYDASADRQSWRAMHGLFDEVFG